MTSTHTKIAIKGMPRKFDATELKLRQEGYHRAYTQTDQCTELVRADLPHTFLAKVVEFHNKDYTLSKYPINMESLNYTCRMIKPETLQAEDLARIDDKIKQEYIAELEAEREQYRQLLTRQLLQAAEVKETEKVERAKAKLLSEIQKEVDATFADLAVPN